MEFSDLYKKGIEFWPIAINIGDGYPTGKAGYLFSELTAIHDKIEDNIHIDDIWLQIIDWSLFQAFHAESKKLIKNDEKTLNTRQVELNEIQWRVLENLKGEGWESLLAEYINDL